jgi:hypothetical protein
MIDKNVYMESLSFLLSSTDKLTKLNETAVHLINVSDGVELIDVGIRAKSVSLWNASDVYTIFALLYWLS